MSALTIVTLNMTERAAMFAPVLALDPERIHLEHVAYRSSWEEVSARRTGAASREPEAVSDDLRAALARADVLFAFVVPRDLPVLAPRLRWLHTPATGIDHLRGSGALESPTLIITTVGSLFAPVIAEHVLAGMLHFAKRLTQFGHQQRAHTWQMGRVESFANRTLGLIGVGGIGRAVAALAKPLGMRVLGVGRADPLGRQVPNVDRLLARRDLPHLLRAADYLVIAVADTPETQGMLGAAELAAMKPGAVLINVARGTIIDEDALVAALRDGRIAGAALDVFAHEPLAAHSPLWDLANVLITPHVAANVSDYLPRAVEQFADNVRRFLTGAALLNQFDRARGY